MIGLIAIAATAMFVLALLSVSADTDEWHDEATRRMARDEELRARYWEFINVHGRTPTTRELWDASPPAAGETTFPKEQSE